MTLKSGRVGQQMKHGNAALRLRREWKEARDRIAEREAMLRPETNNGGGRERLGHRANVELALDAERTSGAGRKSLVHDHHRVPGNEHHTRESAVGLRARNR